MQQIQPSQKLLWLSVFIAASSISISLYYAIMLLMEDPSKYRLSSGVLISLVVFFTAVWILSIKYYFQASAKEKKIRDHLYRYKTTINSYRRWLSRNAIIDRVLENLEAEVEGLPLNSGTPIKNENCTVSSLRQQVDRMFTNQLNFVIAQDRSNRAIQSMIHVEEENGTSRTQPRNEQEVEPQPVSGVNRPSSKRREGTGSSAVQRPKRNRKGR